MILLYGKNAILPFLILVVIFSNCRNADQQKAIPENVRTALKKAGGNKQELVNAITFYSRNASDSLKLKAAYFLIANMDGMYYFQGNLLSNYQKYPELVRRDEDHGEYIMSSFNKIYGPFLYETLQKISDLETVKSIDIINNIEQAFNAWENQPWGKNYSFDDFCEYILPLRFSNAAPENNRRLIYEQFNRILDSLGGRHPDAVQACKILNDKLIKDTWLFTTRTGFMPHFPASSLLKHRCGNCDAMADFATYIMRSVGIPVGNDFVPQWPNRKMGHNWNTVLAKNGQTITFLGAEDSPGSKHKPGTKKGKIYRRTYAINPECLASIKTDNDVIPFLFRDPRIKDVTDQYVQCFDVNFSIRADKAKYGYLTVFDNKEWIPIDWCKTSNNSFRFQKVEGGIVYLPAFYDSAGISPADYPIILDDAGKTQLLKPRTAAINQAITVERIFPDLADDFWLFILDGGIFQGANDPNFIHPDILYTIKGKPDPFLNNITFDSQKKYRYVRYLSAPHQFCDISEIAFYGSSNTKLQGKIIGSKNNLTGQYEDGLTKAMDNDLTTTFLSKSPSNSWVGLDLGRPMTIRGIKYSSKQSPKPESYITVGHQYELSYWSNNGWTSLGIQVAKGKQLHFNTNVTNALFLVHDLTSISDERIFTYKNNKQIWW